MIPDNPKKPIWPTSRGERGKKAPVEKKESKGISTTALVRDSAIYYLCSDVDERGLGIPVSQQRMSITEGRLLRKNRPVGTTVEVLRQASRTGKRVWEVDNLDHTRPSKY